MCEALGLITSTPQVGREGGKKGPGLIYSELCEQINRVEERAQTLWQSTSSWIFVGYDMTLWYEVKQVELGQEPSYYPRKEFNQKCDQQDDTVKLEF
jgi:hypothetical protein